MQIVPFIHNRGANACNGVFRCSNCGYSPEILQIECFDHSQAAELENAEDN